LRSKPTTPLPPLTGGQPAVMPPGLNQMSPVRNTTGALMVPKGEHGTVKLTGPVKVVQVPIAGQPGRYVTGLLPVTPPNQQAQESAEQATTAITALKKPWQKVVLTMLALLVILSAGITYWFVHTHPGQVAHNSKVVSTH